VTNSKYKITAANTVVVGDLKATIPQGKGWYVLGTAYIADKIDFNNVSMLINEP
jgi:hypothetical protein